MECIEQNCLTQGGFTKRKSIRSWDWIIPWTQLAPLGVSHFCVPTSLVNPVIKANFNNVFFKGRGWISPPPPSYDPGGCGFKRMRENGRQAELLQEATGLRWERPEGDSRPQGRQEVLDIKCPSQPGSGIKRWKLLLGGNRPLKCSKDGNKHW